MRTKKLRLFFIVIIILVIAGVSITKLKQKKTSEENVREITPVIGSIRTFISCTGTVLPKNRLEIKPPVNGRIERILVQEGDKVKTGQILAWMSSTERAALLDAARSRGEEDLKYWKEIYKAIPLISPIDGEVIVAKTQPGQTVTTNDAVIVLSDQLIVRAQVDETDIGKIRLGQNALVILDAYPDTQIKAKVEHMYYESKTVNNVTIYEVDLIPEEVPLFFRSGMNATVDFIEQSKENTLLIPSDAVQEDKDGAYVFVKQASEEPLKRPVKLGISDDKNVEVISGIGPNDTVIAKTTKYLFPKNNNIGSNPFMPSRNQGRQGR